MNTKQIAASMLGTGGVLPAGLAPLSVSAADAATVDVCRVTINSVKANDLTDNEPGGDEVFLRLGDTRTATLAYADNQRRRNLGDDGFVGSENLRLIEDDGGNGDNDVIGGATLPCSDGSGESVVSGAGGIYTVVWEVDVLP